MGPDRDEHTLLQQQHVHQQNHHDRHNRTPRTRFQPLRTVLRVPSLVIAITIFALQVYSAYIWLKTRHDTAKNSTTGFQTRIWAVIDAWPTWTMLGVAALATVIHLLAFGSFCGCVYPIPF